MTGMLLRTSAVILAGLLASCGTVATKSDGETIQTQKRTTGFMGLVTKDDIEVLTAKAFAGIQKVVIGGFKVGFNDSKEIKGSSRLVGGTTTGELELRGVDDATRQQITNDAYAHFLQQLSDKGFEIVPRSTLTASSEYQGIKEYDFPFQHDYSGLFSSFGTGSYYSPTDIGSKQPFFRGEIADSGLFSNAPSAGFLAGNPNLAMQNFGEKTGIPVLHATYLVDFASGGSAGFSMQQLELGQRMAVDQGILAISRSAGGSFSSGSGHLQLGQSVGTDLTFAEMVDETTGTTQVVEGAFNLLFKGGILGAAGVGGDHTRHIAFQTDAERYTKAAMDVLDKTNTALVDKLAELATAQP